MVRRYSFKKVSRSVLFSVIAVWISLSSANATNLIAFAGAFDQEKDHLKILKKIYDEVKEFGKYSDEGFISREFFIGFDDDDTNKDIHVVVLIQKIEDMEKMRIQVTYLERSKDNPNIKYAKNVKNILCSVVRNKIKIQSSDYDEKEVEKLVPGILRAIQDKKRLLKSI